MESVTWSTLPAHNLQLVFKSLDIFDVEKCLLVCKHWFDEANFYLKDKIFFLSGMVSNFEDCNNIKRRFQNVKIHGDPEIIEALLNQRNMKEEDSILEARIWYCDYPNLSRMLQAL